MEALERAEEPLRVAILLGLRYGLRRSEICGLRWSDVKTTLGLYTHIPETAAEETAQAMSSVINALICTEKCTEPLKLPVLPKYKEG